MIEYCEVCYDMLDESWPYSKCEDCRNWEDYWDSLTPQEQAQELKSMGQYTGEGY